MQRDNNNGSDGRAQFLSGARTLIDELRERQLHLIGGQDIRDSGFENEEPDADYGEEA